LWSGLLPAVSFARAGRRCASSAQFTGPTSLVFENVRLGSNRSGLCGLPRCQDCSGKGIRPW
jgi:hypothetical protein